VDSLKELNVTTFGKRFKIYNAIKVLSDENTTRKDLPDTTSENNSIHHPSSPVLSSTQSIVSTSSNRQPLPPHIPYADDDLISDYSTVIRNSTTATQIDPTTSTTTTTSSMPPTDPRRMFSLDLPRPMASTDTPQHFDSNSSPSRSATPLNRTLSAQQQQPKDGNNRFMVILNKKKI
jgi:hypothetical protein